MTRGLALGFVSALAIMSAANAADMNSGGFKDGPVYAPNIWTGFYVGMQSGAASGTAKVANSYGPSIFGDKVATSGEFGGAVLGYNTMIGKLVAGVEADANWADLDGTNTCFAASGFLLSSNCHAHVDAFGTLTARLGTTVGSSGRTLFYAKGGAAWESIKLEANVNSSQPGWPPIAGTSSSTSETKWGWTVGAGVERALTGRWSVKAEYDYLNFGDSNFTSPNTVALSSIVGNTAYYSIASGAAAHYSNDLHIFKVGTNYKLTGNTGGLDSEIGSLKDGPMQVAPSWEVDFGARYAGTSSKFQKDLGVSGVGAKSLASRLTYDNMWSDGGELFARIDTPSNIMVKGFVGLGSGNSGHMNDEDWMLSAVVPYSNTVSNISQDITYGTIDAGYDVFRGAGYKVAPFIGYTILSQNMKALGCTQIANGFSDCVPAISTSVTGITEKDTWQALRLGSSVEFMLLPRLKLTAEAAWLPYVSFTGTDNHVLRNLVSPRVWHWRRRASRGLLVLCCDGQLECGRRRPLLHGVDDQRQHQFRRHRSHRASTLRC